MEPTHIVRRAPVVDRDRVIGLCDHVQVRDGLLFIVAGGITRLRRPSYPATLGAGLAVVIEFEQVEAENPPQFAFVIIGSPV